MTYRLTALALVAFAIARPSEAQAPPTGDATPPAGDPAADARGNFGRSLLGGTGLWRVRAATIAGRTIGFTLHGGFFRQQDLTPSDSISEYREATIGATFAPLPWLEIAAATRSATYDRAASELSRYAVTNDLWLALKIGTAFAEGLVGLGLELAGHLPPSYGPDLRFDGLSAQFTALGTFDFTGLGVPLRFHLNTGFVLDRTAALDDPDGSLSRRVALGITPYRQWASALAVEGRFRLGDVWLSPFVEYAFDAPLGAPSGFAAAPMRLVPGVRLLPWRGLIIDLAMPVGLTRGGDGVPPPPSLMAYAGLGYQSPLDPPRPPPEALPPPPLPPPPPRGTLSGTAVDAATGQPVADAIISVPGRPRLLADAAGTFRVEDLDPGPLSVRAEKAGYDAADAAGSIASGSEWKVSLALSRQPEPPAAPATIKGTVVSEQGKPLSATVAVPSAGLSPQPFATGEYELRVGSGDLAVEVGAEGHLKQGRRIGVKPGETVIADFVLKAKPKAVLVVLRKEKIEIKKQVHFAVDKDVILPDSAQLLDQVAATILENAQIARIRIEGHTDSQGDDAYNQSLSDRRARSVMRALLERGVEPGRLTAVGFGESKPIASNATNAGKARNRRVEFMIEK